MSDSGKDPKYTKRVTFLVLLSSNKEELCSGVAEGFLGCEDDGVEGKQPLRLFRLVHPSKKETYFD